MSKTGKKYKAVEISKWDNGKVKELWRAGASRPLNSKRNAPLLANLVEGCGLRANRPLDGGLKQLFAFGRAAAGAVPVKADALRGCRETSGHHAALLVSED